MLLKFIYFQSISTFLSFCFCFFFQLINTTLVIRWRISCFNMFILYPGLTKRVQHLWDLNCIIHLFGYFRSSVSSSTRCTLLRTGCPRNKHQNGHGHNIHPIFGEKSTMIFHFAMVTRFTLTFQLLNKAGGIRTTKKKVNYLDFVDSIKLNLW